MKVKLIVVMLFTSIYCSSQSDTPRSRYFEPLEIKGTPFVVSSTTSPTHFGSNTLVFVNTSNGNIRKVELPNLVVIQEIKNFQVADLGINVIFVKTISKTKAKSSIYNRFFTLAYDGSEQREIQVDKEVIYEYIFNASTGRITFFLNGSNVNETKNEQIAVFDLKTLLRID